MPPVPLEQQITFLLSCVRHSTQGKVDFARVGEETSLSRNGAETRYRRLVKQYQGGEASGGAEGVSKGEQPEVEVTATSQVERPMLAASAPVVNQETGFVLSLPVKPQVVVPPRPAVEGHSSRTVIDFTTCQAQRPETRPTSTAPPVQGPPSFTLNSTITSRPDLQQNLTSTTAMSPPKRRHGQLPPTLLHEDFPRLSLQDLADADDNNNNNNNNHTNMTYERAAYLEKRAANPRAWAVCDEIMAACGEEPQVDFSEWIVDPDSDYYTNEAARAKDEMLKTCKTGASKAKQMTGSSDSLYAVCKALRHRLVFLLQGDSEEDQQLATNIDQLVDAVHTLASDCADLALEADQLSTALGLWIVDLNTVGPKVQPMNEKLDRLLAKGVQLTEEFNRYRVKVNEMADSAANADSDLHAGAAASSSGHLAQSGNVDNNARVPLLTDEDFFGVAFFNENDDSDYTLGDTDKI